MNNILNQKENKSKQVVAFLSKNEKNTEGITVDDIISMSDAELENIHNYIQWAFPLTTPSLSVPNAPYLTTQDATLLAFDENAKVNVLRLLTRMMEFYKSGDFITISNHNFKRISRILGCLVMLGMNADAVRFHEFILSLADSAYKKMCIAIPNEMYWEKILSKI